VPVLENQVSDASRFMLAADRSASIPQMAWDQLDERLRWAQKTNYVFTPGSAIRRYHGSLRDAVNSLGSRLGNGATLGEFPPCVILDGVPRPGMTLDQIQVDEVKAIEVYGLDPWRAGEWQKEGFMFFKQAWGPRPTPCLAKPLKGGGGKVTIAFVSIWTK
jgi:hypothetical protein